MPEWSSLSGLIPEDFSLVIQSQGNVMVECQSPTKLVSEICEIQAQRVALSKLKTQSFRGKFDSLDCKGTLTASELSLEMKADTRSAIRVKHLGVASSGAISALSSELHLKVEALYAPSYQRNVEHNQENLASLDITTDRELWLELGKAHGFWRVLSMGDRSYLYVQQVANGGFEIKTDHSGNLDLGISELRYDSLIQGELDMRLTLFSERPSFNIKADQGFIHKAQVGSATLYLGEGVVYDIFVVENTFAGRMARRRSKPEFYKKL